MKRERRTPSSTDEPKGKLSKEEAKAAFVLVDMNTLTPRPMTIDEINDANRNYWSDAPGQAEVRLMDAQLEFHALYERTKAPVERDDKRQAGTRKERRPDVTDWIDRQLDRDPDAKCPELWMRAPEWLTEQVGEDRFMKRVTSARKRRRYAATK